MITLLRIQVLGLIAELLVSMATPAARQSLSRLWVEMECCQDAAVLKERMEGLQLFRELLADPQAVRAAITELEAAV